MEHALVFGVNGQDGSFLAKNLLRRGYAVTGIARQASSLHLLSQRNFTYRCLDLRSKTDLADVLADIAPDMIFHVAAIHGSAGFAYEPVWQDAFEVNVGSLHIALEHARLRAPRMRLVYASSSKVFGPDLAPVVTEETPMVGSCLYGITKIAARDLILYYRKTHGVAASTLYLFNHESELRRPNFFIPRIVSALAAAQAGEKMPITVATLAFRCDWGAADEYADMAIDVAEKSCGNDFLIASGRTWTGAEFAQAWFAKHGYDYRSVLHEKLDDVRLPPPFLAEPRKLEAGIGRRPQRSILDVCDHMLANLSKRDRHG